MKENKVFENVLNMSVAEFFEKMKTSGKYEVYEVHRDIFKDDIVSYGDTPIDIFYISNNDMLKYSPYRKFHIEYVEDDFYEVVSEGRSLRMDPDDTVSDIVREMEYLVKEHYRVLFRNIKKVIDSGYRYILDNWSGDYEYIHRNAEKHGIKYVMNWEDCHGYMIITDINIEDDERLEMTTYQYHRKK